MVTKDYLDDKLADLRGDLVVQKCCKSAGNPFPKIYNFLYNLSNISAQRQAGRI